MVLTCAILALTQAYNCAIFIAARLQICRRQQMQASLAFFTARPNWILIKMLPIKALIVLLCRRGRGGSSCCFEFCFESATFTRNLSLERPEFMLKGKWANPITPDVVGRNCLGISGSLFHFHLVACHFFGPFGVFMLAILSLGLSKRLAFYLKRANTYWQCSTLVSILKSRFPLATVIVLVVTICYCLSDWFSWPKSCILLPQRPPTFGAIWLLQRGLLSRSAPCGPQTTSLRRPKRVEKDDLRVICQDDIYKCPNVLLPFFMSLVLEWKSIQCVGVQGKYCTIYSCASFMRLRFISHKCSHSQSKQEQRIRGAH